MAGRKHAPRPAAARASEVETLTFFVGVETVQDYIMQEGHKLEKPSEVPVAVTGAVSWRKEGIKYRKNEIFVDAVEKVNLLVGSKGQVLHSEIVGALKCVATRARPLVALVAAAGGSHPPCPQVTAAARRAGVVSARMRSAGAGPTSVACQS